MRVHPPPDHGFKHSVNGRAVQLDGVRAIAMMAICWDHWCPAGWPRVFPFEVFLFLFLVLTGYLITGSLLRERDRSEARGGAWKWAALKTYQIRRGLRILAPYYAALALAWIVRAPDVIGVRAAVVCVPSCRISTWRCSDTGRPGTNHFWSLAIQQQFYLIWPFVIWFLPRKLLVPAIVAFTAIGPVSRMFHDFFLPWFAWPQVLTWACFDYFGIGALFALAVHRGMSLESPGLRWLAAVGLAGYLGIFGAHEFGWPTFGLRAFQQTLLSVALVRIHRGGARWDFPDCRGRILEHPAHPADRPAFLRTLPFPQSRAAGDRETLLVSVERLVRKRPGSHPHHRPQRGGHLGADVGVVALDRATAAGSPLEARPAVKSGDALADSEIFDVID